MSLRDVVEASASQARQSARRGGSVLYAAIYSAKQNAPLLLYTYRTYGRRGGATTPACPAQKHAEPRPHADACLYLRCSHAASPPPSIASLRRRATMSLAPLFPRFPCSSARGRRQSEVSALLSDAVTPFPCCRMRRAQCATGERGARKEAQPQYAASRRQRQ